MILKLNENEIVFLCSSSQVRWAFQVIFLKRGKKPSVCVCLCPGAFGLSQNPRPLLTGQEIKALEKRPLAAKENE